ncbi:MAG: thiol reductase thioredoxin [Flavobacterium sp.]|nr:MAG: thiol reductase thioredoxin [Flavobacterium sp.]
MLLGKINQQGFKTKEFSEWFTQNYNDHTLDSETINTIKPKLKNVNIKVFMGTWCSDSQRETPALYKVLEAAKFNMENFEIIAVNHDKETPKHLEKGMDIQYVPTIIFYKNGKEIGRYVESAQETLEKDMLAILNETGYKHIYEE